MPKLPDDLWALDFVSDQLVRGRRFRILVIYVVCTPHSSRRSCLQERLELRLVQEFVLQPELRRCNRRPRNPCERVI